MQANGSKGRKYEYMLVIREIERRITDVEDTLAQPEARYEAGLRAGGDMQAERKAKGNSPFPTYVKGKMWRPSNEGKGTTIIKDCSA